MTSIDQQVSEACEYLSTMPESEFQARWNTEEHLTAEEKKERQRKANEACDNRNSWLNALMDMILP